MISLNSLAAFTAEVTRTAGITPMPTAAAAGRARAAAGGEADPLAAVSTPTQRRLEAVPPAPAGKPPPRGSLLDLRV